jgi:hypothetical protein
MDIENFDMTDVAHMSAVNLHTVRSQIIRYNYKSENACYHTG